MKSIIASLIFLLFLNGCLNYKQDTLIYPDGSGKMTVDYWMKLPDSTSAPAISQLGIFTPDSIAKQFSSSFSKINSVEVYTDTTDSTIHAIVNIAFDHVDSLNQIKAFSLSQYSFVDGAAGQKIFIQFIPPVTTGFGIDASQFEVFYNYEFRGDIITHNATSKSGKILTWAYKLSEIGRGKTISVTFRPYKLKETPVWIFALAGLVLIVVIFFLFRKKKD